MIRLLLPLLLLASCGGGHHHAAAPVIPSGPAPFADIAGTYTATVTAATGVYAAEPIGETWAFVVLGDGTLTATDRFGGSVVYHLKHVAGGTLSTDGRSILGLLTEFGSAPGDMATCRLTALKLWAGFTDQGDLYGYEDFLLVKTGSG